jgi:hypothetical protein
LGGAGDVALPFGDNHLPFDDTSPSVLKGLASRFRSGSHPGSEHIDLAAGYERVEAVVKDRSDGAGTARIVIAADGSASGSWDMVVNDVFDETAKANGVTGLADHCESTHTFSGDTVTGTSCNLGLGCGSIVARAVSTP